MASFSATYEKYKLAFSIHQEILNPKGIIQSSLFNIYQFS
jgi:hypothetical protein